MNGVPTFAGELICDLIHVKFCLCVVPRDGPSPTPEEIEKMLSGLQFRETNPVPTYVDLPPH